MRLLVPATCVAVCCRRLRRPRRSRPLDRAGQAGARTALRDRSVRGGRAGRRSYGSPTPTRRHPRSTSSRACPAAWPCSTPMATAAATSSSPTAPARRTSRRLPNTLESPVPKRRRRPLRGRHVARRRSGRGLRHGRGRRRLRQRRRHRSLRRRRRPQPAAAQRGRRSLRGCGGGGGDRGRRVVGRRRMVRLRPRRTPRPLRRQLPAVDRRVQSLLRRRCPRDPRLLPPRYFEGRANRLYRNLGDGTFEDVSVASGIAQTCRQGHERGLPRRRR